MQPTIHAVGRRVEALRRGAYEGVAVLPLPARVGVALAGAALVGALAQVRVPLPFTPVPVTGQVFAALLAGSLLGSGLGVGSMAAYLAIGAAGVPWFTGMAGGMGVLTGLTGGYLVGMVAAAGLVGRLTRRFPALRCAGGQLAVMLLGVGVIYACGVLQLGLVLRLSAGRALALGAAPFVAGDVAKAAVAALVASACLPRGHTH